MWDEKPRLNKAGASDRQRPVTRDRPSAFLQCRSLDCLCVVPRKQFLWKERESLIMEIPRTAIDPVCLMKINPTARNAVAATLRAGVLRAGGLTCKSPLPGAGFRWSNCGGLAPAQRRAISLKVSALGQ